MEIVVLWLLFSLVVGVAAGSRGRSGVGWFALSLIITPLFGLILVLVLPNKRAKAPEAAVAAAVAADAVSEATHRRCPDCAEWVLRAARKCKHCGSALRPTAETGHFCVDDEQTDLIAVPLEGTGNYRSSLIELAANASDGASPLRAALRLMEGPHKPVVRAEVNGTPIGFLPGAIARDYPRNVRRHFGVLAAEIPSITVPLSIDLVGNCTATVRLPAALAAHSA